MTGIQSSIGLISGISINDTVDQLMSLAAKPRDTLLTRADDVQNQQLAIGELTALTIAIQMSANNLADTAAFQQRKVSSSNDNVLSASLTGEAAPGSYQLTPVRVAQNHQLLSEGVSSLDATLGEGALQLGFGATVNQGVALDLLNGGQGVQRGKIRITDRSGASDVIDLRYAATIGDVVDAINASEVTNVWAEVDGDAIRLSDQTGQTASNLIVSEVGFGSTAADLGLAGVNVAAAEATGQDVLQLFDALGVALLNDRAGLSIRDELPDLEITFRDNTSLQVDLQRSEITTLGDVVAALNAADPTRLQARLSADGDRLELTDLTADAGGTFAVSSSTGGTLAEDLGLNVAAAGGVLSGNRLLGGLQSVLLQSLGGGYGLGTLGAIEVTDRSGATATVDLADAETLADVVTLINASGLAVRASINDAGAGLQLRDISGATASNLIVANGDATNTADILGLAVDAAVTTVDGGSLHLQSMHEYTRLEELNFGQGVHLSSITFTDSAGQASGINLATMSAETVGDVLDAINGMGIGIEARINDTGDGILLLDTAGGSGTMTVAEAGSGTAAADLRLLGEAVRVDRDGTPTQMIDGAMSATVTVAAGDTLQDLADKINSLEMGVEARIFNTGSSVNPYRLSLISQKSGLEGQILFDTSQLGLGFQEITAAQDAAVVVGSAAVPGAGVLVTSPSNHFDQVIEGVSLVVNGTSETPVTIDVATTDTKLVSSLKLFVDQYNKLHDKIEELTYFNEVDLTTGILFGSGEILRIENTLSRLVTDRFSGLGDIHSLEQIGLSLDNEGKLSLDAQKMTDRFRDNPEAFETFFTEETTGFAARMDAALESLAGADDSLLLNRNQSLQNKLESYNDQIGAWNKRLERQRERLLEEFYGIELAIAKMQANVSALQSLSAQQSALNGSSSG